MHRPLSPSRVSASLGDGGLIGIDTCPEYEDIGCLWNGFVGVVIGGALGMGIGVVCAVAIVRHGRQLRIEERESDAGGRN